MDFEQFFDEQYGTAVRAVALAIGDRHRAEDRVQDAFAKAYRRWNRVSVMERPEAWIYVVALNAERKEWSREQRRTERDVGLPVRSAERTDGLSAGVVDGVTLQDALDRLTVRQRAAVALRYLADLSTADVARAMGCAEGTVKATLHQSLAKLRVELAEEQA